MKSNEIATRDGGKDDDDQSLLENRASQTPPRMIPPSPTLRTRSLSDCGGTTPGRTKLSPLPLLLASGRRTYRDDSSIGSSSTDALPVTPQRGVFNHKRDIPSQQLPTVQPNRQQDEQQKDGPPSTPVVVSSINLQHQLQHQEQQLFLQQPMYVSKSMPLSPKLDLSQTYASPTNILPRRSRGLDFSRAATSLHHSTLADQSSPDSSPTIGNSRAAISIPARKVGDFGGAPESSSSLWSVMGRSQERTYPSSSLGSANNICSDSSSSSDEDDLMDEDTDEPFITTPQVGKVTTPTMSSTSQMPAAWISGSPATNNLLAFQHRQRTRKQPRRKTRGSMGLGFGSMAGGSGSGRNRSKSPPGYVLGRDGGSTAQQQAHSRRESISWAANQLHISGSESDDNVKLHAETPGRDGQRGVIRRAVSRRGNLLPKTKGFARIRAALAEESAPVEADFRREAEVVRQVLDNDAGQGLRLQLPPHPADLPPTASPANSSPRLIDSIDDLADEVMAMDAAAGLGLGTNFKQKTSRSKEWSSWRSLGVPYGRERAARAASPPPRQAPPTLSASSLDDTMEFSPGMSGSALPSSNCQQQELQRDRKSSGGSLVFPSGAVFPMSSTRSSGGGTPLSDQLSTGQQQPSLPSAAEITRRINNKRRRDDDFDPVSFKRRAVSPGMSVHNSPVMQSPLQRDNAPWGLSTSRPGSVSGSSEGKLFPPLSQLGGGASSSGSNAVATESVTVASTTGGNSFGGSGNTGSSSAGSRLAGSKGRVGYQTMADANDSITRLSIE